MQPSDVKLLELWGNRSDGPSNGQILSFAHAVLAEAMRAREGWKPADSEQFFAVRDAHCAPVEDAYSRHISDDPAVLRALRYGFCRGFYIATDLAAAPKGDA